MMRILRSLRLQLGAIATYLFGVSYIHAERQAVDDGDPFVTFTEWESEADERTYKSL